MSIPTTGTSTAWPLLDDALALLRDAVAASAGRQDDPTPCERWTVGQVAFHAAYDQHAWASAVDGGPSAGVDPFDPPTHVDGALTDLVDAAVVRASAAWSTVAPDADAIGTPLPQGPMTAQAAVRACALDAAVHAWDLDVALGRRPGLTDDLATELLPVARTFVEPLRAWGAFAPELAHDTDERPTDTLLRYLGRDPHWQRPA